MATTIINADVFAGLASLPEASVHCCVTSPPYWALRSYLPIGHPDKRLELGSEKTLDEFIANMVRVFEGVRRVLRPDGLCFINLGDSYNQFNANRGRSASLSAATNDAIPAIASGNGPADRGVAIGSQLLAPHRFAIAMQQAGWCLRSTIVWAKKSPMPESLSGWRWRRCRVNVASYGTIIDRKGTCHESRTTAGLARFSGGVDTSAALWANCPGCGKCRANGGLVLRRGKWRPTCGHEYVFMFSPRGGDYFYSSDSAAEKAVGGSPGQRRHKHSDAYSRGELDHRYESAWAIQAAETRNPRSVWTLSTEPSKLKHFAAFPGELVRRCLAGYVGGGCSYCGTPFAPIVETSRVATRPGANCKDWRSDDCDPIQQRSEASPNRDPERHIQRTSILDWRPCCECGGGKSPLTVLDPFGGTGTVGRVADYLGMNSVLIELSAEYVAIMRENLLRPWRPKGGPRKQQTTRAGGTRQQAFLD